MHDSRCIEVVRNGFHYGVVEQLAVDATFNAAKVSGPFCSRLGEAWVACSHGILGAAEQRAFVLSLLELVASKPELQCWGPGAYSALTRQLLLAGVCGLGTQIARFLPQMRVVGEGEFYMAHPCPWLRAASAAL